MIRMSACHMCKHFLNKEPVREAQAPEEIDEYKRTCQAFPDGIPKEYFKLIQSHKECANELLYELDGRFRPSA